MRSASAPQSLRSPNPPGRQQMLDRKAELILSALILVMLGSAIWQVAHAARWSMIPFVIPAETLIIVAGVRVLQERMLRGSADALAAWKKWGGFFLVSCTALLT